MIDAMSNTLHAALQLAEAADRCAAALTHHRREIPAGLLWDAHELESWAEQVRLWVGDMQAPRDPDAPQILPEDCAV